MPPEGTSDVEGVPASPDASLEGDQSTKLTHKTWTIFNSKPFVTTSSTGVITYLVNQVDGFPQSLKIFCFVILVAQPTLEVIGTGITRIVTTLIQESYKTRRISIAQGEETKRLSISEKTKRYNKKMSSGRSNRRAKRR